MPSKRSSSTRTGHSVPKHPRKALHSGSGDDPQRSVTYPFGNHAQSIEQQQSTEAHDSDAFREILTSAMLRIDINVLLGASLSELVIWFDSNRHNTVDQSKFTAESHTLLPTTTPLLAVPDATIADRSNNQAISITPASSAPTTSTVPPNFSDSLFIHCEAQAEFAKAVGKIFLSAREAYTSSDCTGVPFTHLSLTSTAYLVSPKLRKEILAGDYVNLAKLLVPWDGTNSHDKEGDKKRCVLRTERGDMRLQCALNLQDFLITWSRYSDVFCSSFPHRRAELVAYQNAIVDMSVRFGGTVFYEYHKTHAMYIASLTEEGIACHWDVIDQLLFLNVFAGRCARTCDICSSTGHAIAFCNLAETEVAFSPISQQYSAVS